MLDLFVFVGLILLCCPLTWGVVGVIAHGWYEEWHKKRNPPHIDRHNE